MGKYTIQVDHTTLDCFDEPIRYMKNVDITWNNLAIAKDALRRIKEHYRAYQSLEPGSGFEESSVCAKDWYYGPLFDEFMAQGGTDWRFGIVVLQDFKTEWKLTPFWTQDWVTLHGARVVCLEDDDMSFYL